MTKNRNDGLHNGGNSMIAKSKAPENAKMTEEEIVYIINSLNEF